MLLLRFGISFFDRLVNLSCLVGNCCCYCFVYKYTLVALYTLFRRMQKWTDGRTRNMLPLISGSPPVPLNDVRFEFYGLLLQRCCFVFAVIFVLHIYVYTHTRIRVHVFCLSSAACQLSATCGQSSSINGAMASPHFKFKMWRAHSHLYKTHIHIHVLCVFDCVSK